MKEGAKQKTEYKKNLVHLSSLREREKTTVTRRECVKIKSFVRSNLTECTLKLDAQSSTSAIGEPRDTYERVIRDEKGHGIVACVQECEGTVVGLVDKLVVGYPGRC